MPSPRPSSYDADDDWYVWTQHLTIEDEGIGSFEGEAIWQHLFTVG